MPLIVVVIAMASPAIGMFGRRFADEIVSFVTELKLGPAVPLFWRRRSTPVPNDGAKRAAFLTDGVRSADEFT